MMPFNIEVDSHKIEANLAKLSSYSDTTPPAITRVLFTAPDLQARTFLRTLIADLELQLYEDGLGNMFARWPGSQPNLPAVATGSHIDAIPNSGQFDGTVGVLGGLAAIRALKNAGVQPRRSIELIVFTAEEPTRFGIGCLGSRAMCGNLTAAHLKDLVDHDGIRLENARRQAGFTGDLEMIHCRPGHYHAFVELHIEQGQRLEMAGNTIGVVSAIAAPATLRIIFQGEGGHAGAVLMPERRDALLAAAKTVLAVEQAAQSTGRIDSVATVGRIANFPNAVNSIPEQVLIEIDIRDTELQPRDQMVTSIQAAIKEIASHRNVSADIQTLNQDTPAECAPLIQDAIVTSADNLNLPHQTLVSRAYHDTLFMSQLCPSGMIFIPSVNGYSHRPEEYTTLPDIISGVKVLAHSLAALAA